MRQLWNRDCRLDQLPLWSFHTDCSWCFILTQNGNTWIQLKNSICSIAFLILLKTFGEKLLVQKELQTLNRRFSQTLLNDSSSQRENLTCLCSLTVMQCTCMLLICDVSSSVPFLLCSSVLWAGGLPGYHWSTFVRFARLRHWLTLVSDVITATPLPCPPAVSHSLGTSHQRAPPLVC